ncbi:hypothetical protein CCYA_CCYA17G4295 [Cyanidiococcus yangmingshanensis]|nr:hypothetical protein CCYA_CCYA17G4295 [Cyanidiococcus yangmingshanensis]
MFLLKRLYQTVGYVLGTVWRLCGWFFGLGPAAPFLTTSTGHGTCLEGHLTENGNEEARLFETRLPERGGVGAREGALKTLPVEAEGYGRDVSSSRLSPLSESGELVAGPQRETRTGRSWLAAQSNENTLHAGLEDGESPKHLDANEYGSGSQRLVRMKGHDLASSAASRWTERVPSGLVTECFLDQTGAIYVPTNATVRYTPKNSAGWPASIRPVPGFPEERPPDLSSLERIAVTRRPTPPEETNASVTDAANGPDSLGATEPPLTTSSIRDAVLEAIRVSQERSEASAERGLDSMGALARDSKEMRRLMRRVYLIMYAFIFSTAMLMIFFFQQDGPMTSEHRILLCVVLPIYVLCFTMLHSFGDNFPANLVMLVLLSSCSWFAIGFLSAFYLHRSELAPLGKVGGAAKLGASMATLHP